MPPPGHDAVGVAVPDAVAVRKAVRVGVTLLAAASSAHAAIAAAPRGEVRTCVIFGTGGRATRRRAHAAELGAGGVRVLTQRGAGRAEDSRFSRVPDVRARTSGGETVRVPPPRLEDESSYRLWPSMRIGSAARGVDMAGECARGSMQVEGTAAPVPACCPLSVTLRPLARFV